MLHDTVALSGAPHPICGGLFISVTSNMGVTRGQNDNNVCLLCLPPLMASHEEM